MKKIMILLLILALGVTGCGVKQEDYDKVVTEKDDLQKKYTELNTQHETLKKEIETNVAEMEALGVKFDETTLEYEEYKEKMQPYEAMELAEAEAKKAEAERKKAEAEKQKKEQEEAEKAAKKKAAAEKKAKAEAEEAKGYETGITFNQLARTPDKYKSKKVKFSGEVIQVIESEGGTEIRLAIDRDYDQIIYGIYMSYIVESRILEGDYITIYGTSGGLISYDSTNGGQITIPSVLILKIDN